MGRGSPLWLCLAFPDYRRNTHVTDTSGTVYEYSAAAAPRGVLRHGVQAFAYPRRIWQGRSLVWNFFRRELFGRFHGSMLGFGWVLVQPMFQFAVFFAVFGYLFGIQLDPNAGAPDPRFAVYLFAGIVTFGSMMEATNQALRCVVGNANLIQKVHFPCELLPLSPCLVSLVVFGIGSAVLGIAGWSFGVMQPSFALLLWPILAVLLLLFNLGLGLFLSSVFVFARDVGHLYAILSQAWMFATPIFWTPRRIAERFEGAVDLLPLNPMYSFVMAQRQVFGIYDGGPGYSEIFPTGLAQNLGTAALWAFGMFFLGVAMFVSKKHKFADLV